MKSFGTLLVALMLLVEWIQPGWSQEDAASSIGWFKLDDLEERVELPPLPQDSVYSIVHGTEFPLHVGTRRLTNSPLEPTYAGSKDIIARRQEGKRTRIRTSSLSSSQPLFSSMKNNLPGANLYSALLVEAYNNNDYDWRISMTKRTLEILTENFDRDRGLVLESIEVHFDRDNTTSRYSATWTDDFFPWSGVLEVSLGDFVSVHQSLFEQGYRMTDIEYDLRNGMYSGLWIADGLGSVLYLGLDSQQLAEVMAFYYDNGGIPVDLLIHPLKGSNTVFAFNVSFAENYEEYAWAAGWNLTYDEFSEISETGLRLVDYEAYDTSQGLLFAGVWIDDFQVWAKALNYDDRVEFENEIKSQERDLRPINFEIIHDVETGVDESEGPQIEEYTLAQNYPNPFNPETTIRIVLPGRSQVRLVIHDLNGRVVRQLVTAEMAPGNHLVVWDGRDNVGDYVASGVYLYRLNAIAVNGKETVLTRKLTLMR